MIIKREGSQGDLNGFLDAGSDMNGELRFEDTFRIDGRLTGKVTSTGDLVVGEGGSVEGEIDVGTVYISGTVKGQVRAARRLEIAPKGKVYADVQTAALVVDEGAFFQGRCAMGDGGRVEEGSPAAKAPKLVQPMPLQKKG